MGIYLFTVITWFPRMIVGAIRVDLPATVPKYISSFFELIYYRSLHAISNYDDLRLSHLIMSAAQ